MFFRTFIEFRLFKPAPFINFIIPEIFGNLKKSRRISVNSRRKEFVKFRLFIASLLLNLQNPYLNQDTGKILSDIFKIKVSPTLTFGPRYKGKVVKDLTTTPPAISRPSPRPALALQPSPKIKKKQKKYFQLERVDPS